MGWTEPPMTSSDTERFHADILRMLEASGSEATYPFIIIPNANKCFNAAEKDYFASHGIRGYLRHLMAGCPLKEDEIFRPFYVLLEKQGITPEAGGDSWVIMSYLNRRQYDTLAQSPLIRAVSPIYPDPDDIVLRREEDDGHTVPEQDL